MDAAAANLDDLLSSHAGALGPLSGLANPAGPVAVVAATTAPKVSLDMIASCLLKQNFILTALELHTELAETGRELPRLRDFFSNPANFEQQQQQSTLSSSSQAGAGASSSSSGFYPLHRASSIQTFDSLDLTRYSDDVDPNDRRDDRIAVLEFELRKAKETINQLRTTLTMATETDSQGNKSMLNSSNNNSQSMLTRVDSSERVLEAEKQLSLSHGSLSNLPTAKSAAVAASSGRASSVTPASSTVGGGVRGQESEEHDDVLEAQYHAKASKLQLMPHDKNAINFLVNEYLLEQNYKMTSVTFAEENESLDLEDWDGIGLNRSKPPSLRQLYKFYLSRKNSAANATTTTTTTATKSNGAESTAKAALSVEEAGTQTDALETADSANGTEPVKTADFQVLVDFDKDTYENQRMQINKLLEKQGLLLKSIAKLESEIDSLNTDKDFSLKKIDSLTLALEKATTALNKSNQEAAAAAAAAKVDESPSESVQAEAPVEVNGDAASSSAAADVVEAVKEEETTAELHAQDAGERKIPAVFKELMAKLVAPAFDEKNQRLLGEIVKLKISNEGLIETLYKYLPVISSCVEAESRLELLPLILTAAVLQHSQLSGCDEVGESKADFLRLLFNLVERPSEQQRLMILTCCVQFSKWAGPSSVHNELLPQCWEQINDKSDERRMMIAQACSVLAPHVYMQMRSSLMFSIAKQMIEHEKCGMVRAYAARSFSILVNYIRDEQKFNQCVELLDLCATDKCEPVVEQVEKLMMPSLSLWAMSIGKFEQALIMHLVDQIEINMSSCHKHRLLAVSSRRPENEQAAVDFENSAKIYLNLLRLNLQFVFAHILVNFRETSLRELSNGVGGAAKSDDDPARSPCAEPASEELDEFIPKLNAYFHTLQEKIDVPSDLYKLDSILDDYLHLAKKYLCLIETDTWTLDSQGLSDAFAWLSDQLVRKLIQLSAQADARDPVCHAFVRFFRDFVLLFAIDFEFIKSKILPIFEKLLNIAALDVENANQSALEQMLGSKSCPLYKATLPVYFVGILSTLVDVESYGLMKMSAAESGEQAAGQSASQPPSLNASINLAHNGQDNRSLVSNASSASMDKSLEFMSTFLKNVFFALSLNQCNLDGVVAIYELMKMKSKSADYVIQMLLSTLWDGIVHVSLYVRCNTAKLFEILVKDCDEYLLSTRILPALITLANDLDKMVRCSSISPLTCVIENCTNKEILERVYTQLQSFLSDPILKDEYLLQIELLKTFRRISNKCNNKFREEFILPYLAILTMQIKNAVDDNEYDFTLASFAAMFAALGGGQASTASTGGGGGGVPASSSMASIGSGSREQLPHHHNDLLKICVLLYDAYMRLCTINSAESPAKQLIYISRQSIQESLLPGLHCLREIMLNSIIVPSSVGHNEFVQRLEHVIAKIDLVQQQSNVHGTAAAVDSPSSFTSPLMANQKGGAGANSTPPLAVPNSSNHENSLANSPLKSSSTTSIASSSTETTISGASSQASGGGVGVGSGNLMNGLAAGMSSITSSLTTPIQNGELTANVNTNFKSIVFKGITNFNTSKDKLSSFLNTNKTFKK